MLPWMDTHGEPLLLLGSENEAIAASLITNGEIVDQSFSNTERV